MQTRLLPFDNAAIAEAARLIAAGEPVAIATETVYGLATDATNARAVARIYEAKGRPSFNPLIVHVASLADAGRIAELGLLSKRLAEQHWPGPLSIVARLREASGIASLVTAGLPTIALRVPAHPAIRALLEASGRPLAAPSANASGAISPTRAEHVMRSLGGRIPLVVDAGPCPGGIESTIVGETGGQLRLLRLGPIEVPQAEVVGGGRIEAPGQLTSHYAPAKPLRLNAENGAPDEYLIGFGGVRGDSTLSVAGNLSEAAARLFDLLHAADQSDKPRIAVAPVPESGLGAAINDRLRRATAG
ncbi:MAG: L-threonylcarbamoyladenylate synthase [Pseudomonadota bacterium]|nr:threonylcarbamoyl-AMP synthase [Sphingomonas sp.]MDQ3471599.1 L-threonylcarbamoyladenylate synthase [Pseudomonadota bacterium]